jgi:hypothetical protein
MEYLFVSLIVFALYHFVYESILAPSERLKLRFELFELRDRLRSLKIEYSECLEDRHFHYLQDSLNNLICLLTRFDMATLSQIELEIQRDPELRRRSEVRSATLDDCQLEEMKTIREASFRIATKALLINSGGWFVYVVPIFIGLALYLGLTCWASFLGRKIKAAISISEVDIRRLVPRPDPSIETPTF